MKTKTVSNPFKENNISEDIFDLDNLTFPIINEINSEVNDNTSISYDLPEVLFVTSYPPRECGIATYSEDLIKALNNKFSSTYAIRVCALEYEESSHAYPKEVKYILKTFIAAEYGKLVKEINNDNSIKIVLIQHEFGFFQTREDEFLSFLYQLSKPIILVFHTVLPKPDKKLKSKIKCIVATCDSIIVMTNNAANILKKDYGLLPEKISVIAHGTHLVSHLGDDFLKMRYGFKNRKVLTTFGLLSSGKSIETTIDALPIIVKECPEIIFLILGKTHPEVLKIEGEKYREMLEQKVKQYSLQNNVCFINNYLGLPELLEYLQLTDIYLFTTNEPNQAVSGTFAYAMSCACPIISTPIPHAQEFLTEETGIIFNFKNSSQLAESVIRLLNDEPLRKNMSSNTLQKIVSTAWENSAIAHALLFSKYNKNNNQNDLKFNLPVFNLSHLKLMTTNIGLVQFSIINQPDISSGYTLDDNARALVSMCMYYKLTNEQKIIFEIEKYLNFIEYCQDLNGCFLNYVDENKVFTKQNASTNLDDSNGRAIWALGYLTTLTHLLPEEIILKAEAIIEKSMPQLGSIHSTRAMAFAIKGLYFHYLTNKANIDLELIKIFANRIVQMYKHESNENWDWFEGYLTYANSTLPEAILYTWLLTGDEIYKKIAVSSFNFLLSQIFNNNGIEVISNKDWLQKGKEAERFGEQPIDVAYTIMTLSIFYDALKEEGYHKKMETAFNWFLGNNRLHQIIYNPCTGGCYDGLEETHVNLNQGAESTVSYLMARLTVEKYLNVEKKKSNQFMVHVRKKTKKEKVAAPFVNNTIQINIPYFFLTNSNGITTKETNINQLELFNLPTKV